MKKLPILLALLVIISTKGFSQDSCGDLDLLSVNDTSICNGESILISAIAGYDNYSWSTGSENQYTLINTSGTYTVSATYTTNNLVTNGNFSEGNTSFSSSYNYSATDLYPEGVYTVTTNANIVHSEFDGTGDGNFMVVNGSTSPGTEVWCQDITVEPGTVYNFSSLVTTVANGNPALLQFSINGEEIGTVFTAPNTTGSWVEFNATWSSNTETTAEICIINQTTAIEGNDFGLDDITFTTLCTSSESITVTEEELANATIFSVDDLCESETTINLNAVDPGGVWSGNGITNSNTGLFNPSIAGAGNHTISYTIDGTCGDEDDLEIIVLDQVFDINITSSSTKECAPASIQFEDLSTVSNGEISSWEWNFEINTDDGPNPLINYQDTDTGLFDVSLLISTEEGCYKSLLLEDYIEIAPSPKANFSYIIEQNGCEIVVNFSNESYGANSYHWEFNNGYTTYDENPIQCFNSISQSYDVTLVIENEFSCVDSSSQVITAIPKLTPIYVPNVFTPDGNGNNDLFQPFSYCIKELEFWIYDRWGKLIFHSEEIDHGWDGSYEGLPLKKDTYTWRLEYIYNEEIKNENGHVLLLK